MFFQLCFWSFLQFLHTTPPAVSTSLLGSCKLWLWLSKTNIDNDDDKVCRTKPLGKLLFCSQINIMPKLLTLQQHRNYWWTTEGAFKAKNTSSDRLTKERWKTTTKSHNMTTKRHKSTAEMSNEHNETQTNKYKNSSCVSFGVGVLLLCTDGGVGVLLDACTQASQSIQDRNKGPETDRCWNSKESTEGCVRTNWFTSF